MLDGSGEQFLDIVVVVVVVLVDGSGEQFFDMNQDNGPCDDLTGFKESDHKRVCYIIGLQVNRFLYFTSYTLLLGNPLVYIQHSTILSSLYYFATS